MLSAREMRVLTYFALAFAITWGLQAPAWFASSPERFMPLVGLGAFGPMIAAVILGGRSVFSGLKIWRVSIVWYLAALFVPGALFVIAAAIYGHGEPLLYPPSNAAFAAAAIVFPFGEEIGWRGFALPELRKQFGPVLSSVILGIVWTLWHIPMMSMQHVSPVLYVVFFPFMIGGSIFFTWLWEHTNRSLLLCVFAHVGAHLNNPGHALPDRATPIVLHTIAYLVLAVALVALDAKMRQRA
jgi:membrane protease YdiL (CAAX protease family)